MPYCEKCGHKMSDTAVFCSRCGCKVEQEISDTDSAAPVERKNVELFPKPQAKAQNNKLLKNKRIIGLCVAVIATVLIVVAFFFIIRGGFRTKVVTENEDGDIVFAFTLSEFVDRYNKNSSDKLRVDDFEKNEEGYTFYEDDFYLSIDVDKGNYPCYVTSVYIAYDTDDNNPPEEVVNVVSAIYGMSEKKAYKKVEDAIVHGGAGVFEDTMLFLDIEPYEQTWHFLPSE